MVVGLSSVGKFLVLVYWIMGRGENSRNRVFCHDGKGRVFTEAADPAKVTDPRNIIYNAMMEGGGIYVVSNGVQTDAVVTGLVSGMTFSQLLAGFKYEDDPPNSTSRITAVCGISSGGGCVEFSLLRKSFLGDSCDRLTFCYDQLDAGLGLCMTTYMGDGNPLPAFIGEPYLLPIDSNNIYTVAKEFWEALNEANRVALVVKFVDLSTGTSTVKIINKYRKV